MKKGIIRRAIEQRVLLPIAKALLSLSPVSSTGRGGWFRILERHAGAWQQNVEIDQGVVDAYWANFACVTLIASDISKMPIDVMRFNETTKIWEKTRKRPVLKKPNHFQTTIEFIFSWIVSELRTGNTYVLLQRDPVTRFVVKMYVLDPSRVTPMITGDGSIYYALQTDELSGLSEKTTVYVPASEIIHDRMYPLYHPLVGLPPVFACGIAAMQGSSIINTSTGFFANRGMPSGVLTAPGHIPDDTASRLKEYFDTNFAGENAGKVAVLGDNLKFEAITTVTAESAQLIEQLRMTGEMICACYHVPGYKIGVGPVPSVSNTSALNQQYYEQCLQYLVEKLESRLDEGLELIDSGEQCWMDTEVLMRMDPVTLSTVIGQKVKDGIWAIDEARRKDNLPPVKGGDQPFLQLQNYALGDLARRSEREEKQEEEGAILDSQKVTSLMAMLADAADGKIPTESVREAIKIAFPELSDAQVSALVDPIEEELAKEPEAPPPSPAPVPPVDDPPKPTEEPTDEDDPPDEGEEEEETDEESRELARLLLREAVSRAVA